VTEIYGLHCPDTGALRYIGKANCSNARLKSHLGACKRGRTPVRIWLASLLADGKLPILRVLETIPAEQWELAERAAIKNARDGGADLLNVAKGGNQPEPIRDRVYFLNRELGRMLKQGRVSAEAKAKLRYASMKRPDLFPNWARLA